MSELEGDLGALAEFHGVHPRYTDGEGQTRVVDGEVVMALLRALGVPLDHPRDAAKLLRELRVGAARRVLEPVLVHRPGRGEPVRANLPENVDPGEVWLSLELEDGTTERGRLNSAVAGFAVDEDVDGIRIAHVDIDLSALTGRATPLGRHRVTIEGIGPPRSALLVAAPDCPPAPRRWGIFVPLHAVRSRIDWGIGAYDDLRVLGEWVTPLGGGFIGTLPLYPAFLDPPADPSPYLPVSRLAYNEIFVDPLTLPEFAATPEAQALMSSTAFEEALQKARGAPLVAYEEVARLKRAVMEPMARTVSSGISRDRRRGLRRFARSHPELEAYAHFRAARDDPASDEPDPELVAYHLYCQWAAFEQLSAAQDGAGRYADLPIGSHPDGFDPNWSPQSFLPGVHGGAPPDRFFAGGQDWGFNPLHPLRIREDGYAFFSAALQRAFRHADCLRIDHVMGLQRLFMIPMGAAGDGAYVSYRADELHALIALEAHRSGCVVIGEDLGTVPGGVRRRMARDRMLRTWVFQFESATGDPLPDPPAHCLATLGTHDVPRFGAYLWGEDIDDREASGTLTAPEAAEVRAERVAWRTDLLAELGAAPDTRGPEVTASARDGCLAHLARSDAALVLVDIEELWDERRSQNQPGTGPENGNWRMRSARTLEEIQSDLRLAELLAGIDRERAS